MRGLPTLARAPRWREFPTRAYKYPKVLTPFSIRCKHSSLPSIPASARLQRVLLHNKLWQKTNFSYFQKSMVAHRSVPLDLAV